MPVFVGAGTSSFMKGDGGVGVSTMTTAERNSLSGVKKGQIIFNETLNLAQYYDGNAWKSIDSPPIINNFTLDGGSAVTSAVIDSSAGGNATIVINGSLFDTTAATVTFVGTSEILSTASIVRNSTTQLTVTVARSGFDNTNEPYAIKVLNGSGLSATLSDAINQDQPPVFNTAAGNLNSAFNTVAYSADAGATDPDGDTVTHSITSGSLPSGLSINSTNGAITGTPSGSSVGNYAITVRAETSGSTVTRNFVVPLTTLPTGGNISISGNYRIQHFTNNDNFVNPNNAITGADVLVVGGGGGGAGSPGENATSGSDGGEGGAGRDYSTVFGSTFGESGFFAGGGGGGSSGHTSTEGGAGGSGGGGTGRGEQTTKTAGEDGTGGGGGGGSPEEGSDTDNDADGSPGGSGVVLIRYNLSTL